MAQDPGLSERELDAIYTREIRPQLLDPMAPSPSPTAVLIGGQPGAGKTIAMVEVQALLGAQGALAVAICAEQLREFHPHWRAAARIDPRAAQAAQADAGQWYARLAREAAEKRANLVLATSMRHPTAVLALAGELRAAGYRTEARVLAVERDLSRLATLVRYERLLELGQLPRFVPGNEHDTAYARLRESLAAIEREGAVDRVRIVTREGKDLYRNELGENRKWGRPARAPQALDEYRERPLLPRDQADNALTWHTVLARLQARPDAVPREALDQALAWRREATQKALSDPEAARLYQQGLAAEAFRSLPGEQLEREFPEYRPALQKLDKARQYALEHFTRQEDRDHFVAATRERLAEQIAEGRHISRKSTTNTDSWCSMAIAQRSEASPMAMRLARRPRALQKDFVYRAGVQSNRRTWLSIISNLR